MVDGLWRFDYLQVDVLLADLSDLPLVNAALYAKVRLIDGGKFTAETIK